MYAVVGQIPIFEDLSMSPWAVWQVPLVDDLAVIVDEIDFPRTCEMREESVSWRNLEWIDTSESKTTAGKCALLHSSIVQMANIWTEMVLEERRNN
jgi:hypothetical protein